jgi:hypothetical protein
MADDEAAKEARSQVTAGLASDKGETINQLTSSGRSAKEYRSPAAKAKRAKEFAEALKAEENKKGDGDGDGESGGS